MTDSKFYSLRTLRWAVELCGAWAGWTLFRILPVDWASALGGMLMRLAGPWMSVQRVAAANMRRAFPDKSDDEIKSLLRGMWDNLGRTLGELPHIKHIVEAGEARVKTVGAEHLQGVLDNRQCALVISAHFGNWELIPRLAGHVGLRPFHLFIRPPNNPWVHRFYIRVRQGGGGEFLPKGSSGARRALELVKRGEHLGALVDQKMKQGLAVPFFGHMAMTPPAMVRIGARFQQPLLPVRVVRLKGATFRFEILPPLPLVKAGETYAAMEKINALYESWIRECPEQWFWVHRRWSD